MQPDIHEFPHVHVAVWRPKPRWLALEPAARAEFDARVQALLHEQRILGADLLLIARCQPTGEARAAAFVTVWRFPDEAMCRFFDRALEDLGWHLQFEQSVVTAGRIIELHELLEDAGPSS